MQDDWNIPAAFFTAPFKGLDRYKDGGEGKKGWWYRMFEPHAEGDDWVGEKLLIPRQETETS